jgi:adenylate cyclase
MAIKDLLLEINSDVKDIVKMDFELTKTQSDYVPNHEDPGLTFETGKNKKAKTIETCVLYADIRNSTALSKAKSKKEMARLYTAFTKSVLNIAEYHGGVIRNIIGDRVMVVFPEKDCFRNAVRTAISINHVAVNIINKHFSGIDFKCGIGIDYGEKLVIKAGIPKQDKERANYKNLIWISNSANIASKLTDLANKEIIKKMFRVTYNPFNMNAIYSGPGSGLLGSLNTNRNTNEPLYHSHELTKEISAEEFSNKFDMLSGGSYYFSDGKILKFEKFEKKITVKPILISEKVFIEYKKLNPTGDEFVKNWWTPQDISVKEYSGKIYGCELTWAITDIVY